MTAEWLSTGCDVEAAGGPEVVEKQKPRPALRGVQVGTSLCPGGDLNPHVLANTGT